ncbi:hypothetical protein M885DRAFT_458278 [Pelagophyceae sp. CCMP2097]|nr:hypothetical protein M885DRAFT_458278 [Pelagophyceae sp. CCMP2097]
MHALRRPAARQRREEASPASAPLPARPGKRRGGLAVVTFVRLCCFLLDGGCLARGVANALRGAAAAAVPWVVGGAFGLVVLLRARRARLGPACMVHLGLGLVVFINTAGTVALPRRATPKAAARPAPLPALPGRALGYDDDAPVGWAANLGSVPDARVRHARLLSDVDAARLVAEPRATNAFCWRDVSLRCVPTVYLLGAPKCGTSDLYERLSSHPLVAKARRKETRFFTRGEFGAATRTAYMTPETPLSDFAAEHETASKRISSNLERPGNDETTIIDGGPHTLWWSTQTFEGGDTGNAPAPQLLALMFPRAKLVVTLAEPGRRAYSDYWFLTAQGVAGRPRRGRPAAIQSAADFDAKARFDADAMERCFDAYDQGASKWAVDAVQRCAFDRKRFGANGRGRLTIGLYAAFLERWFASFDKAQILVLRLEDRETPEGQANALSSCFDFLGLDAAAAKSEAPGKVFNAASRARDAMFPETAAMLRRFYAPHNARLAEILGDDRFLWRDAWPNENRTGVAPRPAPQHEPQHDGNFHVPQAVPHEGTVSDFADDDGSGKIVRAIARGDLDAIREHVELHGATPREVSIAAMRLDPAAVRILAAGVSAGTEEHEAQGFGPLHCACLGAAYGDSMKGSLMFALLLGRPSVVDDAIRLGDTQAGDELLERRGKKPSYGAADVRFALGPAVTKTVEALLESKKFAVNAVDARGRAPLHHCAFGGWGGAVALLSAAGGDVDAADSVHGGTPLHLAALAGQPESMLSLLRAGASSTLSDTHGHSLRDLVVGKGAPIRAAISSRNLDGQKDAGRPAHLVEHDGVLRELRGELEKLFGAAEMRQADADVPRPKVHFHAEDGGWRGDNVSAVLDLVHGAEAYARCDFDVVDGEITDDDLFEKYLVRNRPVIVRGLVDSEKWPRAHAALSLEKILARHGSAEVTASSIPYAKKFGGAGGKVETLREYVEETRNGSGGRYPWYVFKGHPVRMLPLKPTEDWFVDPDDSPVPPAIYHAFDKYAGYADRALGGERPPMPDAPRERLKPFVNMQFAIGGAGSGAPMHFHNTAWNALVYGSKFWLTYPPAYNLMSNVQIRDWDDHRRAEDPGAVEPLTCVQHAGDVAIIPELWGHGVINLDDTVAIATEVKEALWRSKLPRAFGELQRNFDDGAKPEAPPPRRPPTGAKKRPPPPDKPRRLPRKPRLQEE